METTLRNPKPFKWFWWLIVILVVAMLFSCGSKKKVSTITKETIKKEKDLTVFEQKEELSIIDFTRTANALIIEPNDPNIPLIFNKDTIHNAKKVTYKKEKVDSTATNAKTETVEIIDKGSESFEIKEKNVQMEREGFSWSGLKTALIWIAIVLIIGIVGYLRIKGRKIF